MPWTLRIEAGEAGGAVISTPYNPSTRGVQHGTMTYGACWDARCLLALALSSGWHWHAAGAAGPPPCVVAWVLWSRGIAAAGAAEVASAVL